MKTCNASSTPDFAIPTVSIPSQPAGESHAFVQLTRAAESLGYNRIWAVESTDRESFSQATIMALASSRLTVGTDIVSFYSRTPTVLAMGAYSVHEISGGRFILGIGPGGTDIIKSGHGIPFERPLERARETIEIIRLLHSGERINYEGALFQIRDNFRLRLKVDDGSIPIYMSAINPRMLELAGELADGVMLTHLPIESIPKVKEHIAIGAERSGRTLADLCILANQPVGVPHEEAVFKLRRSLCLYLASDTFDWLVGDSQWTELRERVKSMWWDNRRSDAARLVTDEFVEAFGLGYRQDVIQDRIKQYLDAGVVPILYGYGLRDGHEVDDLRWLLDVGADSFV